MEFKKIFINKLSFTTRQVILLCNLVMANWWQLFMFCGTKGNKKGTFHELATVFPQIVSEETILFLICKILKLSNSFRINDSLMYVMKT